MIIISPIIQVYIRQFDDFFELESYKWKAVKCFHVSNKAEIKK